MIHTLLSDAYVKHLLALIICVVIAFIDKMDAFKHRWMFYVILGVIGIMLLTNRYDDYGFILLFIAMLTLTYTVNKYK